MFLPESEIFLWIKPKKKKETFFVESLDQCRRLEVREKARNVFVMSPRLSEHKELHNIAFSSSFFFDSARIFSLFSLLFRTSNLWSLRNLIKQLIHSRLLYMRLVIANSAQLASLAIYHLIYNARSWNNCYIKGGAYYRYCAYVLRISRYSGFPIGDAFKHSDIFARFKTIRRE